MEGFDQASHPDNSWPHYGGAPQGLQHDWGDEYICRKPPVQTHFQASRPGPATFLTLFLTSETSIPLAFMPSTAQCLTTLQGCGSDCSSYP